MKKIIVSILLITTVFACSDTKNEEKTESTPTVAVASKGATLIAGSDCATCHKMTEKIIGPSYLDIANKYAKNPDIAGLAGKIINGGTGVWGQVPMTAHASISEEDAKEMVTYILSTNK
jgi:cytochrome c